MGSIATRKISVVFIGARDSAPRVRGGVRPGRTSKIRVVQLVRLQDAQRHPAGPQVGQSGGQLGGQPGGQQVGQPGGRGAVQFAAPPVVATMAAAIVATHAPVHAAVYRAMQEVAQESASRPTRALTDAAPHAGDGLAGGDTAVYDLLVGTEGKPDNHGLQLVEGTAACDVPAHRHHFEQVHVMLEGTCGFGPGLVQNAGSVGYFCEGTTYGQTGTGRSLMLRLQVGGPSGAGLMSRRQMRDGIAALSERGRFEEGHFTWYDAQGIKQQKDCYEAVWEQVHGRPIYYARPQYSAPVMMEPDRFAWLPMPASSGVWLRTLGRFNDRGLAITQLKLAPGAELLLPRGDQMLLLCCTQGGGRVEGRAYERLSSLRVEVGEAPRLRASRESIFYGFELPYFG